MQHPWGGEHSEQKSIQDSRKTGLQHITAAASSKSIVRVDSDIATIFIMQCYHTGGEPNGKSQRKNRLIDCPRNPHFLALKGTCAGNLRCHGLRAIRSLSGLHNGRRRNGLAAGHLSRCSHLDTARRGHSSAWGGAPG